MNKREFAQKISNQSGISQKEAMDWIDLIIKIMTEQLINKEEVKLRGFGTFRTKKYAKKIMINPQTKEEIEIPERYVPVFLPGNILKDLVKDGVS